MLKKLLSKVKEQIKKMSGSKPEKKSKTNTEKNTGERRQGQKPRTQSSKSGYKKRTYSSPGSAPYDKDTGRRRRPAKQGPKPAPDKTDDTANSTEPAESSKSTESPRQRGPRKYDDSKVDSNRYPRQRRGRRPGRKFEGERNTGDKPGHTPQDENEVKAEHGNWDVSSYVVEPAEGKKRFHDLNLPGELLHAIADLNYQYCTPIQAEVLEKTLEGRDATGKAQTGTGKTAAFLITAITHLLKNKPEEKMEPGIPRVLIIAPTRELVIQIERDSRNLTKYTKLRTISVFGGMDYRKQRARLSRGKVDILVATPGRLLDFMSKGGIKLGNVELLVLDEADRMLDMGFIPDVKKIVRATPPKAKRQTLFFSATINDNVARLAQSWTKDSIDVSIDPENVAVDTVEQKVFIVSSNEKYKLLHTILDEGKLQRVIIFANRRDETKLLEENLRKDGISCQLLSGDVDQRQRLRTLDEFKDGTFRVLVATDVASRGLHIEGVSHVINFTLPEDPEDYVHRIGRTGRAGSTGISISFASEDDSFNIPAIEKFIGRKLKCIYPEDDVKSITEVLPEIKAETSPDIKTETDTAGRQEQPDIESKQKPHESGSEEDEDRKE